METITLVIWGAPKRTTIHLKKKASKITDFWINWVFVTSLRRGTETCYLLYSASKCRSYCLWHTNEIPSLIEHKQLLERIFWENSFFKTECSRKKRTLPSSKTHHFCLNAYTGSKEQNRKECEVLCFENVLIACINHQRDVVYEINIMVQDGHNWVINCDIFSMNFGKFSFNGYASVWSMHANGCNLI